MTRRFTGKKLVVASHNKGKVREINDLLRPLGVEAVSAGELNLPEPDEDSGSFVGNARIKSHAAATATGLPALSDDSGLVIPAIGGDPGVDSALWGGPERDFGLAMEKVHQALINQAVPSDNWQAYFVCVLSLAWPDGHDESFEGRVTGRVVWPPRGDRGFGYDPMFIADGETITFGEMDPEKKHGMSHRADAFRQLLKAL